MIKLLSLFSGIGAFECALRRGGHEFQTINYCEIDKYASTAYSMIHNRDLLEKDVPEKFFINTPNAIALARKIAEEIELNHPAVLRSVRTDYGKEIRTAYEQGEIHEKRANMREFECRPDDLCNTLTTVLKDNYIAEPVMRTVGDLGVGGQRGHVFSTNGIVGCLSATDYKDPPKILQVGNINNHQSGIVFDPNEISPCVCVGCHISPQKIIQVGNIVKTGQFDNPQRGRIYDPDGLAPTLNTVSGGGLEPKIFETKPYVRIRKLTPRECFRLMGFADDDFDKIKGISNSQLYKMAGNSIVVNVLTEIFKELFNNIK